MVFMQNRSRIMMEAAEWMSERHAEAEGRAYREAMTCRCRRPVYGGSYMRQVACRICGKLLRSGQKS